MENKDNRLGDAAELRRRAEEMAREKTLRPLENLEVIPPEKTWQTLHELRVYQIELEMQNQALRQTQEELESSRMRYFNLYDLAPVGYFTLSEEGLILKANLTASSLLGVEKSALVKKSLTHFIFREDEDIYYHYHQQLFETGAAQVCELRLVKKDGSLFWAQLESTIAQESENGNASCYTVIRDITQRKQAEEKLKDSEEYLKILFDHAPDAYYINDLKGNFIDGNRAAERLIGYKRKEIIGKSFLKLKLLSAKDMPKATKSLAKSILGLPTGPEEYVLNREDKSTVEVEISNYPVKVKGKTYILGIARDITERKLAEDELQQSYQKTKRAMDATIETMSKILEAKDPYTAGHQQRVSQLATAIAKELNFSEDKIEGIRIASLIHDIGKIGLPTEILSKPIKLTDIEFIEFSLIKEHPQIGYNILKSIDFSYPVAQIVLQHHERLNGSGYPNHLKGDKILLEARIIGVADVVEAMSSHRPYRPALGIDKALEEISQNRGILYDPEVVDACIKLFREKDFKF